MIYVYVYFCLIFGFSFHIVSTVLFTYFIVFSLAVGYSILIPTDLLSNVVLYNNYAFLDQRYVSVQSENGNFR